MASVLEAQRRTMADLAERTAALEQRDQGMSSRLDLRVAKLERAPGAAGVELRVYGTQAEADADVRPPAPGTAVVHVIITGVPQAPCTAPCRLQRSPVTGQTPARRAARHSGQVYLPGAFSGHGATARFGV